MTHVKPRASLGFNQQTKLLPRVAGAAFVNFPHYPYRMPQMLGQHYSTCFLPTPLKEGKIPMRYIYSRFASRRLAEMGLENMHNVGDVFASDHPRIERIAGIWCITLAY